jgi:polar amino acid transport system substrate-binding protein
MTYGVHMMRNYFILFVFVLGCGVLHADTTPLRVGMELAYPPFETICGDGTPCGVSVDMAGALGEYLERPISIENVAFVGLIPALKTGRIDCIISSMSVTPERSRSIAFSEPYVHIGLCLLISASSTLNAIDDANQEGCRIVVKSGSSGEVYALKHLRNATIRVLDKESLCVLEVVQGKVDAFIYDQLSVWAHWKRNLQTTRANLIPFHTEAWAIGIKKGNEHLLEQVNAFLQSFRAEGGFQRLKEKYLKQQAEGFSELNIPFIF